MEDVPLCIAPHQRGQQFIKRRGVAIAERLVDEVLPPKLHAVWPDAEKVHQSVEIWQPPTTLNQQKK